MSNRVIKSRNYFIPHLYHSTIHHLFVQLDITHTQFTTHRPYCTKENKVTFISPKWIVNVEGEAAGAVCDGAHTRRTSCAMQPVKSLLVTK